MFLDRYNQAFMEIRKVIKMVMLEKEKAERDLEILQEKLAKKLGITDYKDITPESLIEMRKDIDQKILDNNLEKTEKENEMKVDDSRDIRDKKEKRDKKKEKKKDKFWFKEENDDLKQDK